MRIRNLIPWRKRSQTDISSPLEELRSMESIERTFETPWMMEGPRWFSAAGLPDVEVKDNPKEVVVIASVPGLDKDNLRVDVTESALTIRGERKSQKEGKRREVQARADSYQSFFRSFILPAPVKASEAKALYKNGVLTIELPKAKESQVRRIEIT